MIADFSSHDTISMAILDKTMSRTVIGPSGA